MDKFIYQYTDNGYCRAYYKRNGSLYCLQLDRNKQYLLFACTSYDGFNEPSHEVAVKDSFKNLFELPTGNTETDLEIIDFINKN